MNILLTYNLTSSFQSIFSDSRPMTLCHVTHHVSLHHSRNKRNKNIRKRKRKSKKIDKMKRKLK